MNRLPLKTTLISAAAAIGLFAIASWFEDDARWVPPQPTGSRAAPERPSSGIRGPLETTSAAESCERSERLLQESVEASRYCAADDDCTLFDYGYPIQCLTSVAKSEISNLRLEFKRYEMSCDYRVYYDCPTGEADRQAVCRENRCSVELETIDSLREETLEHLGIDH